MRPPFDPRLYLITDRHMCATLGVEQVVAAAARHGATMVQLRDDDTPTAELVGLAGRLRQVLDATAVPLIVNNRIDVARASGAAGAHVGQTDLPPDQVRRALGPRAIIGLSITDPAQVTHGNLAEVDYLGVGPVFATATKADAASPLGLEGLAEVRRRSRLPIVAIGGVDASNAASAIHAGADGVAVVSAICAADDPGVAAARLAAALP